MKKEVQIMRKESISIQHDPRLNMSGISGLEGSSSMAPAQNSNMLKAHLIEGVQESVKAEELGC